jgi:hypothetical protein
MAAPPALPSVVDPSQPFSPFDRFGLVLAKVMDDSDEFVGLVAVLSGELDEFLGSCDYSGFLRRTSNGDASTAPKLEQSLIAEFAQCSQDGIGVHAEHGREVLCGWQPLAGLGLAVCDCAADLAGDLLVQHGGIVTVDLDSVHGAIHNSVIGMIVL